MNPTATALAEAPPPSPPGAADLPGHFQGDFKEVLAHLAGGVAIVACWDGEAPRGLLVSSITGLSVEPPRFLFCVRKEARCHDVLAASATVSVALLGASDREEALRFGDGSRWAERFAPDRWSLEPDAPPAYRHGLATAICAVDSIADAQTHSIFIVTAIRHALAPASPLIAWNRSLIAVD